LDVKSSLDINMTPTTTSRNTHRHCLICGDLNPQSFGLRFSIRENGSVHAVFNTRLMHQGYDGILHGGVIASLIDAAMTHCLFGQGIEAVTADLQVRFLQVVPCDQLIEVQAEFVERRSPLFRLRAELTLDDCVLARGHAKFIQRKALA